MAATVTEAPLVGASELRHISGILEDFVGELLGREPEPLTTSEAQAIIADYLAHAPAPSRIAPVRPHKCRCDRPLIFERRHCFRCGHDVRRVTR